MAAPVFIGSSRFGATVGVDTAGQDVAPDELLLAAGGLPQRGGDEAVDIAERSEPLAASCSMARQSEVKTSRSQPAPGDAPSVVEI